MNAMADLPAATQLAPATRAAVLLIPGMLNSPDIWDGVIRQVRQQMGDTVVLRVADVLTQSSIADMARDAWASLQDVPVDVPCYVVGFSMGGFVTLEMLAHPERPLCEAWLISTNARPESPDGLPRREKAIAAFERNFDATVAATAQHCTFEPTPAQLAALVPSMLRVGKEAAIRQTRAIMVRRDLRAQLASLQLPVHVMCGREDLVTPSELSEELAELVPHAELELLDRTGHMLPFEQAGHIARSLCARLAVTL